MFNLELIISILEGNVGVGNYYHWWIMNKYYYSWGMCPHLFFLSVLFHLQYRPWMAGVDGDGGTEVRLMMVEDGG